MRFCSLLLILATTALGQGGTPDTFLRLRDTPDTYAGQALKFVRVNAAANRLEFASGGGSGAVVFTDLTDVPSSYTGQSLKSVRVNAGETALEFFTGGTYTDEQAQDAVGAMIDGSLTYVDATPLLQRSALTGAVTASAGSNTTALGSFTIAQLNTAVSDANLVPDSRSLTIGPTTSDLSADRTFLANVTNDQQAKSAIYPNTVPSNGQLPVGSAALGGYAPQVVTGSGATISLNAAGVFTISSIANASLVNTAVANLSGTNTGDQTSIVGITGTLAQFNTALTGADFASGGGTATGTNTGDQTSIVGITGTKAQFDTAVTDGNILYVGDVTQYTDEAAQDAVGAMVDGSLTYVDATPLLQRAALTGAIAASAGSNTTTLSSFSSADLRGALTDENGTGVALFNGATKPDFTSGFTISAAAASGKIPIGDGTSYVTSTPTYPNSAGTNGYDMISNGTNFVSYPNDLFGTSTSQQTWAAAEAYLAGSTITIAAGDWKVQGTYYCSFDVTKTSVAGTAAPVIKVYMGTLGTTGDTVIATLTFPAQTGVADNGVFEVWATFRTVGSGTSAVLQARGRLTHNLSITGLSVGVSPTTINTSAGFNSTTQTKIGISATFGTSFVGTTQLVAASLVQP